MPPHENRQSNPLHLAPLRIPAILIQGRSYYKAQRKVLRPASVHLLNSKLLVEVDDISHGGKLGPLAYATKDR